MSVPTRSPRWFVIIACTTVMLLHSSCLPDYFPRREVKETVTEEQVIGRWHLTDESAAMLNRQNITVQSYDSTVELFTDGRCVLHSLAEGEELISGRGTWKIEHDVAEGRGSFQKNELRISVTSDGTPGICFFNFSRKHNRLLFWQYYGDPDRRQYIEYERS